jgi:hypothetical protein
VFDDPEDADTEDDEDDEDMPFSPWLLPQAPSRTSPGIARVTPPTNQFLFMSAPWMRRDGLVRATKPEPNPRPRMSPGRRGWAR